MARIFILLNAVLALLGLAACASAPSMMKPPPVVLQWTQPEKRVVFMEPQLDLRENPLSGDPRAREDWNRAAKTAAVKQFGDALGVKRIVLVVPPDPVAFSDLADAMSGESPCPRCGEIRSRFAADYALYVTVQSTYDTAGNSAAKAVGDVGSLLGAGLLGVIGGPLAGCAVLSQSLGGCRTDASASQHINTATVFVYDLHTGGVVWSHSADASEWRDDASVKKAVRNLLAGSPF